MGLCQETVWMGGQVGALFQIGAESVLCGNWWDLVFHSSTTPLVHHLSSNLQLIKTSLLIFSIFGGSLQTCIR